MAHAATEEALLASGQAVSYSTPVPFGPTNTGITSVSWWCVETNYVTNSSTWISMADLKSSYDLTNRAASTLWPGVSGSTLNSRQYIHFVQADNEYLYNSAYTASQPDEVCLVARVLDTNPTAWNVILDGNSSRQLFALEHSTYRANAGGSTPTGPIFATNRWEVFNIVFNGASSCVYTNGVLAWTADFGSGGAGGLALGIDYFDTLFGPASMDFAEMSTYSAALGAVDSTPGNYTASTVRSNLVNYYTNKYAIAQ